VLGAATGFVCALFWPMVKAFDSILIEPASDVSGTIGWLYQLRHESGYHLFGTTHHTLTGAPFGWDGSNGLNINWLLPYYPAYLLTKVTSPVGAYNIVLLAGYVLSGAAMYLLVRYLGCGRLVATWAGLVYIVFPWHLMRVPHASLVHLEFFPLLLLALVAASRQQSWPRSALVGAATLACWLTSGYLGAMAVVIAVAFALGVLLTRSAGRRRVRFFALTTSSALAGTLVVAALAHAAGVGRDAGLDRPVADVYSWGVHLDELVFPAARNFIFGDWTAPFLATRQHGSYPVETTNYLGILTIALGAAWLVLAWRRGTTLDARKRLVTPALVTVAVIALVLSLPGRVSVLGQTVRTPSWLFWQIVPAFRVPSRWSVVVETALVPLAAFALQEAVSGARRSAPQWKGKALAAAVAVTAMVASFLELAFDPTTSRLSMQHEPPEYAALTQAPQGIVAVYPLLPRLDYLLWQTVHHRPLLDTNAFGSPADDAQHALVNPRAPGTAQQLALLGVTTIVTEGDALRWSTLQRPNPRNWGPGYRLIARTDTGSSTWRVVAKPGPAFVAAVSGFGPPEPLRDGTPVFPLISSSGVGYFTIRAKQAGTIRLSFDASPPKGGRRVLRLADDSRERAFALSTPKTHISVVVAVPRGLSLLLVKTDPAPQSRADAIVISRLEAERTTEPTQLNALPQDGDPGF
jgi:hypothetical protein